MKRYLLLILPFMWGCAEKKETVILKSDLKCGDTVYNLYYHNLQTGEVYRSEKAVVVCDDTTTLSPENCKGSPEYYNNSKP